MVGPVKCCYQDCIYTNATKSMFTFPICDEPRLKLWIQHSGNANLTFLTHKELRYRFICEEHFDAKYVLKNPGRARLSHHAVPLMYKPVKSPGLDVSSPEYLKVLTPQKVYTKKRIDLPMQKDPSSSSLDSSVINTPLQFKPALKRRKLFEDAKDEPEVKRLRKQVAVLQRKNKEHQDKIRRLTLKSNKKKMIFFESLQFSSEVAKTFAAMQLRVTKKKWTKAEKELCLSIYYKSPSTYTHMRRQGIILAAPSTIRTWLGKTNCLPGLQKEVIQHIEKRFKAATFQEKSCVLVFDEMSIMSSLEYSKKFDQIEGFQDYGRGERMPIVAKYVLVFLIRGLYSGWKIPLAYFLSAGNVAANKLTFLIKIIITKLFDIGLLPKAIVSDQISTNQKTFKDLGVTPDSPFFFCNGRKIFAFFDIPHALKNLRNNFLNSDFTDGDKIFTFSDVTKTYEIDKNNKSKCLHKLTPAHINPNNFQKMKVSLAAQIFSKTVAATLRTVIGTGDLRSDTALDTANFIETINNAFDALNSKKRTSKNPFNRAITNKFNHARHALLNGKKLLKKLKKILKKKNGTTVITRPPSFDGFLQSIEGILQLFDEEATNGIKYLLTYRLNQDVLENLFAVFRLKAGYNKNPSARVVRTIFRSNLVNSLLKTSVTKNCLEDDDRFINLQPEGVTKDAAKQSEIEKPLRPINIEELNNMMTEMPSTSRANPILAENPPKPSLEECSTTYFAGYLAKKCLDLYRCENCKNTLIKKETTLNDKNQLYILNKLYQSENCPKLHAPSDSLVKLVDTCLNIFNDVFDHVKHTKNILSKLYKCTKPHTTTNHICKDHEDCIIKHLFVVKIFDYCKSYKKYAVVNKMHNKLRILKNM